MTRIYNYLLVTILAVSMGLGMASCKKDKDDDEPKGPESPSLIGTWTLEESDYDPEEGAWVKVSMVLNLNEDNTGRISENWTFETKASSSFSYAMNFSWSTTVNANGDETLVVSYVSGDKNTEIFMGSESTVLWKRQIALTGNILNIYGGSGVWVFNKR